MSIQTAMECVYYELREGENSSCVLSVIT